MKNMEVSPSEEFSRRITKQRYAGKIKFFNVERGFGFIKREDDVDLFFHCSGIQGEPGFKAPATGDKVTFEVSQGKKGFKAVRIKVQPVEITEDNWMDYLPERPPVKAEDQED